MDDRLRHKRLIWRQKYRPARRRHRESCERKVKYSTADEAKVALAYLKENRTDTTYLSVYLCTHCREYHVGNNPSGIWKEV